MPVLTRTPVALSLALSACLLATAAADEPQSAKPPALGTVVVTAKREFDPIADAAASVRIQAALHDDPLVFDAHVTVVTVNGVVYLEGLVFDDWDLRRILRLARRLADGRRIVNHLEWVQGGSD